MHTSSNTRTAAMFNAAASLDLGTPLQAAEQGFAMPIELDADSLRHVAGGDGEANTPVVSW